MMRCAIGASFVLMLTASLTPGSQAGEKAGSIGGTLFVVVTGAEPDHGQIVASLYDSQESDWKRPRATRVSSVQQNGRAAFVFPDLTRGDYALSVLYDQDMDGELDTTWFGDPLEPQCYSNNARADGSSAPSFDQAAFKVSGRMHTITIDITESLQ